jgi:hypothetical protein
VSDSLRLTRKDWILAAATIFALVCMVLLRAQDVARWGTAVPLVALLAFGCALYWPLRRRQWIGLALNAVLVGAYWAGFLPLWALALMVLALSLLVPFAAAVHEGYRGT